MSNENDWLDFNALREAVSMEMLIIHFGLFAISRKGAEVRLKCPFHNGKSDNSMAIDLARNSFYCFGCKAKGDVLEFVAKFEDCSLYEAAQLMEKWFFIYGKPAENNQSREAAVSEISAHLPPITPAHLIASIEHQLAELKKLMLSR